MTINTLDALKESNTPPQEASTPSNSATSFKGGMSKKRILARRFFRNIPATIGVIVLGLVILFAFFGQFLTPWKIDELDFVNASSPPGTPGHLLGTNIAGVDMVALLVTAVRISLIIGAVVGISSAVIAAIYGCLAAYYQGRPIEKGLMIFLELMILMPAFLMIAILTNGRGGNWVVLMFALVLFGWMGSARLVRGMSSSLIDREFVKAARFMGISPIKIVMRHLIPNIASQVILSMTMGIWGAILAEISFSFLGIGVKIPDTSLGLLIGQAKDSLDSAPWLFWEPVIALLLITLPLSWINDGLRDAFDPTSAASGKTRKK